ncbi:GGDEF domain-containing protein [Sporosarcina aquimarina]|uniref:Sensor domain-containing diguanylate cyclase n=1 Tax=Sporosarcina aquimarina TaxID=114975 RepID=A0ABU4FY54_9BACL|nr:sensor domain-containing diguanylate cyclase [Sporosarcina aquimarina]MDW0109654.1 sensor domain-containing diguanylate cyclase [Sporosarcina aquimarina]
MNLKGRPMVVLLLLWILIVPTGIVFLLSTQPIPDVNMLWITLSIFFGFLSIYFPIIYNGKSVILFVWFTLPIFLLYGLTTELLLTQIIVALAVFARYKTGDVLYRFLYNSLAYFLLSIAAAAAYFLTGAEVGEMSFWLLIGSVLVYQIVYSLLYDGIFKLYSVLTGRTRLDTLKETILLYLRMIMAVPLALSLYLLLIHYGFIGFLLIGIPFFTVTIILRLNTHKEDLNSYIQAVGEIGQQLAKMTTEETVIDKFMSETAALFRADYLYLFDNHDGWLEPAQFYYEGLKAETPDVRLASGVGIAGRILSREEGFLYSRRDEWIHHTVTTVPDSIESLLCVPLIRHQKIVGVFLLGSKKRGSFKEFHLNVLDLLSSYFIVAVEKALYIEKAERESNRCALTGLYNYRFLENQLEKEMALLNRTIHQNLAVVVLDIDHFKRVNDTYGHENGNRVLKQLADLLQRMAPEKATVARYGGEEFVYILPDLDKEAALIFAETLRQEIEKSKIIVTNDLSDNVNDRIIHITSSIGVSAAPADTDEALALLRNADRALYIGAKQAGRNRVGSYMK